MEAQASSSVKQPVPISSAPKRISKIQFSTLTSGDIQKFSEIEVSSRELFQMPTRAPAPYGCMDARLGISDKRSVCQTCNKKLIDCAGHFGYIPLELPVFHAGYFKHTLIIMQCICKQCSRILLPLDERQAFLKKIRNPNIDAFGRGNLFKKIVTLCKRNTVCPYCHYSNGVVKKISGCVFKIIHEKFRAKNVAFDVNNRPEEDEMDVDGGDGLVDSVIRRSAPGSNGGSTAYAATILSTPTITHQKRQLREIISVHPELKSYLSRSQEVLTPVKCYEALQVRRLACAPCVFDFLL
jgi:DNA-directed RNA polymerase III subunit RPC1